MTIHALRDCAAPPAAWTLRTPAARRGELVVHRLVAPGHTHLCMHALAANVFEHFDQRRRRLMVGGLGTGRAHAVSQAQHAREQRHVTQQQYTVRMFAATATVRATVNRHVPRCVRCVSEQSSYSFTTSSSFTLRKRCGREIFLKIISIRAQSSFTKMSLTARGSCVCVCVCVRVRAGVCGPVAFPQTFQEVDRPCVGPTHGAWIA